MQPQAPRFAELPNFPGWTKSGDFIKSKIIENDARVVADIGGGRMPRVDIPFVKKHNLTYHLFDISNDELARADKAYHKTQMDVACADELFDQEAWGGKFDLIYSHMLLEHLVDPMQAHRNFFRMLRAGGVSIHMFPSKNNFPLTINGLIPEVVSNRILRFIQPHRNSDGQEGKFEAHYKYCGVPGVALRKKFESMGYEIETYTSFVGHEYYKRIRPLAAIERALRPIIVKAELPFISANLLILRKPLNS